MELQWSARRSRSSGSRRSTGSRSTEEKEKELLVYHRRSVQEREVEEARRSVLVYHRRSFEEREATEARRRDIKETKEAEALEAMCKLKDSTLALHLLV
jgi:hypothetical protein